MVDVARDSAYGAVLVPGSVIVKINNAFVTDLRAGRALLGRGKNLMLINQRGTFRYIQVLVD